MAIPNYYIGQTDSVIQPLSKPFPTETGLEYLILMMVSKKHTGITVEQFNEDWRRHMNTYYYGYRAQKEAIEEIGKVVTLPIKKIAGFSFFQDSTQIAISGLDDKNQRDMSLFVLQRDTTNFFCPLFISLYRNV